MFTSDLLTFQSADCDPAVPLRHVTGFPASDYYGGLRPTPGQQSTADLPAAALAGRTGRAAAGMVPTFTMNRSTG